MKHFYQTKNNELVKVEFFGRSVAISKCLADGKTIPNNEISVMSFSAWHFVKKFDGFKARDKRVNLVKSVQLQVNQASENVEIAKLFKPVPVPQSLVGIFA